MYLEKNITPNESKSEKKEENATIQNHQIKKDQPNQNEIKKAEKVIDYFIENQSNNGINLPDFKIKSKQKRLFKKCLKLKKVNPSQVYDKTGKI